MISRTPPGSHPTGCAFQRLIRPRAWRIWVLDAPQTPFRGVYNPIFSVFGRNVKGLINSLRLLCPLYWFVPLCSLLRFLNLSISSLFRYFDNGTLYWQKNWEKVPFISVYVSVLWQSNVILTKILRDGPFTFPFSHLWRLSQRILSHLWRLSQRILSHLWKLSQRINQFSLCLLCMLCLLIPTRWPAAGYGDFNWKTWRDHLSKFLSI